MLDIVNSNKGVKRGNERLQLHWAIVGKCFQCNICHRYFADYRQLKKHLEPEKCGKEEYQWKYSFAKTNDSYFCYHGCDAFKDCNSLQIHLLDRHEDSLRLWGISSQHLRKKTHGLTGFTTHGANISESTPSQKISGVITSSYV